MADTTDTDNVPDTPQEVFKLLPAKARLTVFSLAALAGLALTAITTGLAAVQAPSPQWLTIALAVFPVITSGLGILAGSNIQKPTTVPDASVTAAALLADEPATSSATEASLTDADDVSTTAPSTASTPVATFTAAPLPETATAAPEATPTA